MCWPLDFPPQKLPTHMPFLNNFHFFVHDNITDRLRGRIHHHYLEGSVLIYSFHLTLTSKRRGLSWHRFHESKDIVVTFQETVFRSILLNLLILMFSSILKCLSLTPTSGITAIPLLLLSPSKNSGERTGSYANFYRVKFLIDALSLCLIQLSIFFISSSRTSPQLVEQILF